MFSKAITKKPCSRFSEGITTSNLGKADYTLALKQYRAYVDALSSCGIEILELEADENFPDSCFVEDTAVIADEVAVITNPGAASRNGEVNSTIHVIEKFRKLEFIKAPGTLEGGDVMQIGKHFYIGLTARTNRQGAMQFAAILKKYGYESATIPVTPVLHLKTAVNYIGKNNLLALKDFGTHPAFKNYDIIEVEDEELYAANCLFINGKLIMPAGFNNVKSKLLSLNYDVIELDMTEFEKMDGGLTCLSLRFK
jgi:dimethylargininase